MSGESLSKRRSTQNDKKRVEKRAAEKYLAPNKMSQKGKSGRF